GMWRLRGRSRGDRLLRAGRRCLGRSAGNEPRGSAGTSRRERRGMRVLVACELSGIVRDAFIEAGHDALSCDLLETERPGPHHRGDVRDVLGDGWDLMVAHPPCTYLALSGVKWLYGGKGTVRDPVRWALMQEAAAFFRL